MNKFSDNWDPDVAELRRKMSDPNYSFSSVEPEDRTERGRRQSRKRAQEKFGTSDNHHFVHEMYDPFRGRPDLTGLELERYNVLVEEEEG